MRAQKLVIGAAAATGVAVGAVAAYAFAIEPWWRSWGVDPVDASASLPGDDLVPSATVSDTRGLDIDAPPSAVWPRLLQMGYGRAGWYSYDAMDMRGSSADTIQPGLQRLAVGDLVPTSPTTGFAVKVLDPDRALVLYVDQDLVEQQTAAERAATAAGQPSEEAPANLKLTGAMMPAMPRFAASWAFVLVPRDGGTRTHLIERTRASMTKIGRAGHVALPVFAFGVFFMTRKQMLGLKKRAEREASATPLEVGG